MESDPQEKGDTNTPDCSGDVFDFLQCFNEQEAQLKETIGKSLGNDHDCEDALQETALRGWKYRFGLKGVEQFPGWISQIAVNVVRNFFGRGKGKTDQVRVLYCDELVANAPAKPGLTGDPQKRCQVREMLDRLPPEVRDVFIGQKMDGLTVRELAEKQGCHENTVRNRLKKAKTMMDGEK